ncbi:DUF4982 domain-containing protein [Aquimarina sp. ERC-38]|uniref:glycoside hydrolase family 2 TIM barrel-domain containing protein n=1 Tax=Aquimarina sp. ERC-38 TaxID=2949996 RepID=UPI002246136D|nr:glycoside hydrolase family 2 TIM barrel-domain containing protein [Aquimarina sp. ERC-38]UZO82217.1 DUF4982 domain-containing protein [Aquimarina sp. ERC-38]
MKFYILGMISLLCFNLSSQPEVKQHIRITENFNKNWKFQLADSIGFKEPEFDDTNWRILDVPHDWSREFDFDQKNSGRNAWLPGGIAWYRKEFTLPESYRDKHIEIQFDGVYRHAQIYVNGEHVGNQYDGYTSFYYDISLFLKFDEPNHIAVRVDNSVQPNSRWYTGSGIYRNTWLRVTDELHIRNWGTSITTPKITKEEATVAIETTVENYKGNVDFELETVIYNAEGLKVGATSSQVHAGLLKNYQVDQQIIISSPELWSDETPVLYTALSKIIVGGKVVDDYTSVFGIRTIEFDAEKGFFLNGKNKKLKGLCIHHDAGVLGAAVPVEVWKRRLQNLKDIGCNAIRTAHNPASPELMDVFDEMGFLVMDEFVDKWYDNESRAKKGGNFFNPNGFGDPNFYLEWKENYRRTIFRDRNHPSVIMWSVGNENHSPDDARQSFGLKKYTNFVRTLDPTRPVISGMERGKDKNPAEKVDDIIKTTKYMDLVALNYGEQWNEAIAERNPGKAYVSTESYIYFSSSEEKRFSNIEKLPWFDVLENDHNIGAFLWTGIDYLGESRKFPKLGTDTGLLDIAGFRKERSYLYQAFWTDTPMVRIAVYEGDTNDFSTSGKWYWPPINETWNLEQGKPYDLVTYTNCESVDLYVNGKKIGNKKLADVPNWIMKWRKVNYQPGIVKAVGIINGKEVCKFEIKTHNKPKKINFKIVEEEISTNDIVQIELCILDKKGVLVNNQETELNIQLLGDGKILGISNGNISDTTRFTNTTSIKTKKGRCLIVLKTGHKKGKLQLTAQSEKLKNSIEIKVN